MANLKFARGTTTPTYSTTGFTDGCVYFNTSNQNIYLRNGTASSSSTVEVFKGTDTLPRYKHRTGSTNTFGYSDFRTMSAWIQGVPTTTPELETGEISGVKSWHDLYGQGVVSCYDMMTSSSYDGFDTAISTFNSTLPPLNSARYIVCAVCAWGIAYQYQTTTDTTVTNLAQLSSSPMLCIVTCYRTTESSFCTDDGIEDWSGVTTKPMFVGHCCPKTKGSSSNGIYEQDFMLYLCCNGTNDIYASGYIKEVGPDKVSTGSFSTHSGLRFGYQATVVPNIEKYVYPIYIQY